MRMILGVVAGIGVGVLWGCGVPREAGQFAAREEVLLAADADDASVRAALGGQADAWGSLADLLHQRALGGVAVKGDFGALVEQAAALARRQKALIDAGEDDPADNRRALQAMRKMWGDVKTYLGE